MTGHRGRAGKHPSRAMNKLPNEIDLLRPGKDSQVRGGISFHKLPNELLQKGHAMWAREVSEYPVPSSDTTVGVLPGGRSTGTTPAHVGVVTAADRLPVPGEDQAPGLDEVRALDQVRESQERHLHSRCGTRHLPTRRPALTTSGRLAAPAPHPTSRTVPCSVRASRARRFDGGRLESSCGGVRPGGEQLHGERPRRFRLGDHRRPHRPGVPPLALRAFRRLNGSLPPATRQRLPAGTGAERPR